MAVMREVSRIQSGAGIIFDADVAPSTVADWFRREHWAAGDRLVGKAAAGRGAVVFVDAGDTEWALRHYHRGGLVGPVLGDRYLWTGADRTRSFREWRLLARLRSMNLPVPRPVAAGFRRRGAVYTADIITERIVGAESLSRRMAGGAVDDSTWRAVGECIRAFHEAGVFHADLNAHNLMIDGAGAVWLLDFDRGQLRPPGPWHQANLDRLQRSLAKVCREDASVTFSAANWDSLRAAYAQMPSYTSS